MAHIVHQFHHSCSTSHSRYQSPGDAKGRSVGRWTRQRFPEHFGLSSSSEAVVGFWGCSTKATQIKLFLLQMKSGTCSLSSSFKIERFLLQIDTQREHPYESFSRTQSWFPSTARWEMGPMQQEFPHTEDTPPHLSCHTPNLHVSRLNPVAYQNFPPPLSPPAYTKFISTRMMTSPTPGLNTGTFPNEETNSHTPIPSSKSCQ